MYPANIYASLLCLFCRFAVTFFHILNLQGGKSARIVNCVLALKSYNDWKQGGGIGSWKFGTNFKSPTSGKYFFRKNSEPFANSVTRTSSLGEKSLDSLSSEDINEAVSEIRCFLNFYFYCEDINCRK